MSITDYVEDYKRWCKTQDLSEATIDSYEKYINRFVREIGDLKVSNVCREDFIEWTVILRENAGNGYVTNCLWGMKSFLDFLKDQKDLNVWSFENFKIPRRQKKNTIEHLTNEEVDKLLEGINLDCIYGLRLRTLLEVMLNTGLRPSEALNLDKGVVNKEEVEIVGKGDKERKIYINDRARKWIRKYLERREDNHEALFVTHCKARRVALRTVEEQFKDHFDTLDMDKHVTLHTMRHTYGTNLFRNGCNMEYVQRLLGHSKPEATRKYYVAVLQDDAKDAQAKYLDYES